MKLLITGSNGFVGSYFINKYESKFEIKKFSFLKDKINTLDCKDVDIAFHLSALVHQMGGASAEEYEKVKGIYIINRENIEGKCKEDMIILHPLPRVDEISTNLDDTKYALYFKQAKNGVPVRQAMMMTVLNKVKEFINLEVKNG